MTKTNTTTKAPAATRTLWEACLLNEQGDEIEGFGRIRKSEREACNAGLRSFASGCYPGAVSVLVRPALTI